MPGSVALHGRCNMKVSYNLQETIKAVIHFASRVHSPFVTITIDVAIG